MKLLHDLTAEQLDAATAVEDRVLVSAGAGSGKTLVLAARIACLIEGGVHAEGIAALTFTRAACEEIRSRVIDAVGPVAEGVLISTFHEAALRLGPSLGSATVAEYAEVEAAIRSLYKGPMRRPARGLPSVTGLRDAIMRWEALGGESAAVAAFIGQEREDAVGLVRSRLRTAGVVATWDLLPRFFQSGTLQEARYAHVLVDEAQDTTPAETRMANGLARDGVIFSVGDQRQAIMGWRGAEPAAWGKPTHELTQTFRFGAEIARAANAMEVGSPIKGNSTADDVAPIVLEQLVDEDVSTDCAILTRTHADAEAIERLLPGRVRHVRRDPHDALSSPSDHIAKATAQGLCPVLTVHGAKGREWDQVIVIGPSTIPWGLASEDPEEQRVLYVAMTRARRRLLLVGGESTDFKWRTRACGVAAADQLESVPAA